MALWFIVQWYLHGAEELLFTSNKKDVPSKTKQTEPKEIPMTRGLVSRVKSLGWSQPSSIQRCTNLIKTKKPNVTPGPRFHELDLFFFIYKQLPLSNFIFIDLTIYYFLWMISQCQFPHPYCGSNPPAWKPKSGSTKPSHFPTLTWTENPRPAPVRTTINSWPQTFCKLNS